MSLFELIEDYRKRGEDKMIVSKKTERGMERLRDTLSVIHSLTKEQAYILNSRKDDEIDIDAILAVKNCIKNGEVFEFRKDNNILQNTPQTKIYEYERRAFNAFLPFREQVDLKTLYRANEPAVFGFIKNTKNAKKVYEVILCRDSDDLKTNAKLIAEEEDTREKDDSSIFTYIFVIMNMDVIDEMPEVDFKYTFAYLDYLDQETGEVKEIPAVRYFA